MRKIVKTSKYILTMPLRGSGDIGDIISVKPGYGRYLERYGKATRVTQEILDELDQKKLQWKKEQSKKAELGEKLFGLLQKIERVILKKKTTQDVYLYSSIKKEEVITVLQEQNKNILVDKSQIIMNSNIKKIGEYPVIVNVYGTKDYEFMLEVIDENITEIKKESAHK